VIDKDLPEQLAEFYRSVNGSKIVADSIGSSEKNAISFCVASLKAERLNLSATRVCQETTALHV
jgi:hypothetical protein